jgi:iron-sulfur cluster repair protein YtfE (RIC family)
MEIRIGKGPKQTAPGDVVDSLLDCHERIRRFIELAQAIAVRRELTGAELVEACARVERYFREALPLHVRDEEDSIEPRLRGLSVSLDRALDAMHAEHLIHDPMIEGLLQASALLREQPGDLERRRGLGEVANALARELDPHLRQEEEVVFPALRTLIGDQPRADILDELRARRR